MKYAHLETERRFLISAIPEGIESVSDISDFYIVGSHLRLRAVETGEQTIRKLGQKVRLGNDPRRIAHTTIYLNDSEWQLLSSLPTRRLHKRRHYIARDGIRFVVDEHDDGTLVAEFDGGNDRPADPPEWLAVIREVTDEEPFTGGELAAS